MVEMTRDEHDYILAGSYQMLDNFLAAVQRERLLAEKKYDKMLERKNGQIANLEKFVRIC